MKDAMLQTGLFSDVINFLNAGDVLVLNDTKVIKSRLFVHKNGYEIELFLHKNLEQNIWQAFARPAKKIFIGDVFTVGDSQITIINKLESGEVVVRLDLQNGTSVFDFFEQCGCTPLPPYIKRSANPIDDKRYQTVFSNSPGSVAAPTAGLHFTDELLEQIKAKGVKICHITLHVGAGTFLPVKTEDIAAHKMHYENYSISSEVANAINLAKKNNNRIIAVGTTALRAMESASHNGLLLAKNASTDIFIRPGFHFQIVDVLITNFHLPKSTLLMLVSAFAGYENIKAAYQFAISNSFRFFSYGDANLIYKSTDY